MTGKKKNHSFLRIQRKNYQLPWKSIKFFGTKFLINLPKVLTTSEIELTTFFKHYYNLLIEWIPINANLIIIKNTTRYNISHIFKYIYSKIINKLTWELNIVQFNHKWTYPLSNLYSLKYKNFLKRDITKFICDSTKINNLLFYPALITYRSKSITPTFFFDI